MFELNYYDLTKNKFMLDGAKSGVAAWLPLEGKYLEKPRGGYLFKNIEILKSILFSKGYTNRLSYDIVFIINEDAFTSMKFSIDSLRFNPGTKCWEGFPFEYNGSREGGFYFAKPFQIKESYVDNVSSIGYIEYNDSNKQVQDRKENYTKQNNLLNIVKEASNVLSTYPHYGIYTEEDENNNFCIRLVDSTARIHICTNNFVMDFNNNRRKFNLRCLPFIKDKNKYGTLYCYATVDESEKDEIKIRAYNIIDVIICYIDQCFPELEIHFDDVIYKGYIEIKREED